MIGGPDGVSQACQQRADIRWSLSQLTLPHGLARVLFAEQCIGPGRCKAGIRIIVTESVPLLHLASSSPRRMEILTALGITFTAHGVDVDERREGDETPDAMVLRLALAKAAAARQDQIGAGAGGGYRGGDRRRDIRQTAGQGRCARHARVPVRTKPSRHDRASRYIGMVVRKQHCRSMK